jgi:hypothetical protein
MEEIMAFTTGVAHHRRILDPAFGDYTVYVVDGAIADQRFSVTQVVRVNIVTSACRWTS